jgi:hypothetical protein
MLVAKNTIVAGASKSIFSKNLKTLMDAKGVKPGQMAIDLGISPFRVDRWLAQVCFPKYEQMILLCNYLGYRDIYSFVTTAIDVHKGVDKE